MIKVILKSKLRQLPILPYFYSYFIWNDIKQISEKIKMVATHEQLELADMFASISLFYHSVSKSIHIVRMIGMFNIYAGKRDPKSIEQHNSHCKLFLPNKSQQTVAVVLSIHQQKQCCSPSFVRIVLNEQFLSTALYRQMKV